MRANQGNILVVDDNRSVLSAVEILLEFEFAKVTTISSPNRILSLLEKEAFDLILLDMNFSAGVNTGNEGLYWLHRIKEVKPDISVVMFTAYGDVELAVNALKQGATDFVLKPWDNEKLVATLKSALQLSLSRKEVKQLKQKEQGLKQEINREGKYIMGSSQALMKVLNLVRKVAKTDANVLITGENGTGKELIARDIHRLSQRHEEVMVGVDMGAISETLFESELFGHVKGAFTDARENRPGKFETANNGTLFLDEIGNLSFALQAKLLAAVQNRVITRVGANKPIPVNIRLICATNQDLEQMVSDGVFREDLLYRINTIHIEVPPLRERGEDILLLADFFLKKYGDKYGKSGLKINIQAREKLMKYRWPGNIRELQHTIEKAVILCDSNVLKPADFFFRPIENFEDNDIPESLEEMERKMILNAINKNDGNHSAAANQLGITRQTLYNKLKKYNL
ncbi:sigma-54-dependent Fis family transcriptional regulator [Puteibacter caeruleilacunae]|nr:sigma-54-dependent Fis family transcriptional regulator [Puteibacter caeruleilacunae]